MTRKSAAPQTSSAAPAAPPFATAWASLVYALCALSLAWPALVGKFLVNDNSDQYKAGFAFREFAADWLKTHGGFPQWNAYLFGGMPYVAAMHGDIFYPTFLLRMILPTDVAMTWGMILHFFLCGLATYWFLRVAARLSFHASVVGGVAYMMGGFVSSLLSAGHDGKLFVSALLPLTLLVVTWGMRDGKKWAWGVIALVVGLGWLTPHPQLLQYLLLTTGCWSLFLAFGGVEGEALPRQVAFQRLGLALGAVVIGSAIGAIQFLPVKEYVAWSPRTGGKDYDYATSFSFPLEELFNTYLPEFSGILSNYWGRNGIHFHSEYVGASVLMLASAAFGGGWAGSRKRFLWFWVGTGVVSLLWALGGSTPFFQLIYALVPGTKFFRAPSTIFYVTTFAIAVCAAYGTERLLTGRLSARFAYGWLISAAVVAGLAFGGMFTSLAHGLSQIPQTSPNIEAGAADLKLGAVRSLLFVALAAGAVLLLSMQKLNARVVGYALAAICALDLWSVERQYWQFSEPAAKVFAADEAVNYLKKLDQPARVIAVAFPSFPSAPGDPFLGRDALMSHRVRLTLGYHGNELGRYQQLDGFERGYDQIGNPSFWALTNTQYLYVNADSMPGAGMTRVVGPVMNAAGSRVSLYKLPGSQPFAWVAPAIVKYADPQVIDAARTPTFPVRQVAIFDTSSKASASAITRLPDSLAITTKVTTYEPGHIALTLSEPAPAGSALVVSENFYPGWTATVDGKATPVERADLVLMGIALPTGAKQVELTFKSESYETGKMITLAALALALIAAIGGAALERRSAGAPIGG